VNDLMVVDEENKNVIDEMINFDKKRKIYKIAQSILVYQNDYFPLFGVQDIIDYFCNFQYFDENHLYKISIENENKK
jgi:hypothetical protein